MHLAELHLFATNPVSGELVRLCDEKVKPKQSHTALVKGIHELMLDVVTPQSHQDFLGWPLSDFSLDDAETADHAYSVLSAAVKQKNHDQYDTSCLQDFADACRKICKVHYDRLIDGCEPELDKLYSRFYELNRPGNGLPDRDYLNEDENVIALTPKFRGQAEIIRNKDTKADLEMVIDRRVRILTKMRDDHLSHRSAMMYCAEQVDSLLSSKVYYLRLVTR